MSVAMTLGHDPFSASVEPSDLAQLLRGHRRAAGLTQAELAARAGVGVRTVRDLERGRSLRPQRTTIELLAGALGLTGAARTTFVAAARGAGDDPVGSGTPTPIPPPPELIGREGDLAELVALLTGPHGPQVISLVGLAGVGKTALALAVGHAVHPGEARGVQIGVGSDVAEVLAAVLEVFGAARVADLAARIGDRPGLLLVDAAERAPEAVARTVPRLAEAAPSLRVLITSRHPLGLPEEWVRPVPPLEVPAPEVIDPATLAACPAVALFTARLAQVRREPPATEELPALATLVRRTGGLPLAIELMAARGRLLSLTELLDRYGDRVLDLDLAVRSGWQGGQMRRDEPRVPVQETLRDAVAASYRLLDDEERAALRRFAAFGNRWSLELAEEMLAGTAITADPVRLLDRFLELGLLNLRGDAPLRFRLLDAVRDYALERASGAGESTVIRRRHARVIARFVERTVAGLVDTEACLLDEVRGDIDAALAYAAVDDPGTALRLAVGLPPWWRRRGQEAVGREWLSRLLTDPGTADVDPQLRARAALEVAALAGAGEAAGEESPKGRDRSRRRGVVARTRKPPVVTPRSSSAPAPPCTPPRTRD